MKWHFGLILTILFVAVFALALAPQAVLAAGPAPSEADYAIAAYSGVDLASVVSLEDAVAKAQCAQLSGDTCNHSYVTRTNAFAKLLGVPAVLVDVGDNVGQLTYAGKILAAIGHAEYP